MREPNGTKSEEPPPWTVCITELFLAALTALKLWSLQAEEKAISYRFLCRVNSLILFLCGPLCVFSALSSSHAFRISLFVRPHLSCTRVLLISSWLFSCLLLIVPSCTTCETLLIRFWWSKDIMHLTVCQALAGYGRFELLALMDWLSPLCTKCGEIMNLFTLSGHISLHSCCVNCLCNKNGEYNIKKTAQCGAGFVICADFRCFGSLSYKRAQCG